MPPRSSLIHLYSAIVSTTDNVAKIMWNTFPFGATASTPDPDLEEAHRKILLSAFSYLKDPDPSIAWEPYQSPSSAPPITAFLAISRTKDKDLRL